MRIMMIDYYELSNISNTFDDNFIKYERDKMLLLEKYLNKITPYLAKAKAIGKFNY